MNEYNICFVQVSERKIENGRGESRLSNLKQLISSERAAQFRVHVFKKHIQWSTFSQVDILHSWGKNQSILSIWNESIQENRVKLQIDVKCFNHVSQR